MQAWTIDEINCYCMYNLVLLFFKHCKLSQLQRLFSRKLNIVSVHLSQRKIYQKVQKVVFDGQYHCLLLISCLYDADTIILSSTSKPFQDTVKLTCPKAYDWLNIELFLYKPWSPGK